MRPEEPLLRIAALVEWGAVRPGAPAPEPAPVVELAQERASAVPPWRKSRSPSAPGQVCYAAPALQVLYRGEVKWPLSALPLPGPELEPEAP